MDQISPHLEAGYERVGKQNAVGLRIFLEYGCWLELAYELFRLKKWKGQNGGSGTWQEWLTVNVGNFSALFSNAERSSKITTKLF